MDERQRPGGYGDASASPDGLGSNFISFGPDSEPDGSQHRWPPWNRRGGRGPREISGNRRGHAPFMGRDGPNQSYPSGFNRPFGNSRSRGFHQSHHMRGGGGGFGQRGNRNQNYQRHQGPRPPNSNESFNPPISAYYHPSMVEDPWLELETLLKIPQSYDTSSSSKSEENLESENTTEGKGSDHSLDSEGSE